MPLFSTIHIIASCAFLPILITFWIGVLRFRVANREERVLILLVGISLLAELISSALWRNQLNNIFISHLYVPIELFLMLLYFRAQFSGVVKTLIGVVGIVFVVGSIIDSTLIHSPFEMNDISRTVECIILIAVSLLTWGRIMKTMEASRLIDLPLFWINAAVLVYFSAITLLFIFSKSILSASSELAMWIWSVHLVFMTVYYSLFSIGLWKIRPKTISRN